MLQELGIFNFQSHKETHLKFHPGVNVIVGTSDSGKSAILRALKWLSKNRPLGDSIRSTWGGDTFVTLNTDNGIVLRSKDKSDTYSLGIPGREDLEFKAFGTSVPEEVNNLLNINEVNWQEQHDPPFLLSKSSGEVAQYFNKVARLDKIDLGLQNIQKWIRELNQTATAQSTQITEFTEELEKFDYLPEFEKDLKKLETLETQVISKQTEQRYLSILLRNMHDVEASIAENKEILDIEPLLTSILISIEERNNTKLKVKKLDALISNIIGIENELEEQNKILAIELIVNNLLNLYNHLDEKEIKYNKLDKLCKQLVNLKVNISKALNNCKTLQERFEKEFPDICPLCGKPK